MSNALSYATAAPGVHASRYGRRLRQHDFNNASEISTVLEAPSSSVVALKKGKFGALPAPLHPPSATLLALFKYPLPSKTHKLRPSAAA
jgi:hypothetical protein